MFRNRNQGRKRRKSNQRGAVEASKRRRLLSEQLEDRRLLTEAVQQVRFEDTFEASSFLDNSKWTTAIGSPTVLSEGAAGGPINAGGNRALNLDAGWIGSPPNDQVITKGINLNSYASAQLKYRVQAEGQGQEPGAGDDLLVQYTIGGNVWQTIRRNENADTNNASFNTRYFDIPESAMQGIAFRFLNLGDYFQNAPTDDWFVDDVKLTAWRPHVTISDATVTEGNAASFNVKLIDDAGNPIAVTTPITVTYDVEVSSTGADPASSADFTPRTDSVTFAAGQTSKTVTVATTQDSIDELSESFQVRLTSAGTRAEITDEIGVGTIADNDPTPEVAISVAGQAAGSPGQVSEGDSVTFNVTLDRQSSRPVTVNYVTQLDSASVDDLTSVSGTLTFAPGEQPLQQITVSTIQDDIDEELEAFSMQLSVPSNALLSQYNAVDVSIADDDATPTISISSATGTEGDVASSPLAFDVLLSNPSSMPITVDYATSSQSAIAGEDFASASGTLAFAPGALSQSFSVGLLPDDEDEGASEGFDVVLSNAGPNSVLGTAVGTGTILDDDASPVARTDFDSYVSSEGAYGMMPDLEIDASTSSDADSSSLLFSWDLGNDGSFDRVSHSPFEVFSYQDLAAAGLGEGPTLSEIRLDVTDGTNSGSTIVDLEVVNEPPEFLSLFDPQIDLPAEAGGWLRKSLVTSDVSLTDSHTVTVDYGDGSAPVVTTLPPGIRTMALNHQYQTTGNFHVQIDISDGVDGTFGGFFVSVQLGSALPAVDFTSSNQNASEGDFVTITASLSSTVLESVFVPLIATGSASEFQDYVLSQNAFEFAPGETTATIQIDLPPDGVYSPDLLIDFLMTDPVGAQLGSSTTFQLNVANIDVAPDVNFANTLTTLEEGAAGTLTAILSNPSSSDVVVPLLFSGSATEGSNENYLFPGSEIRIPAGATSASKSFVIADDDQAETAQSLFISMGLPTGALPGTDTVSTFLIPANDTPIVDLRAASILVDEASGTSNILVDLSNPIAQQVSVPFTISGTAQDGSDFTYSPNAPLVFAANQTSAAIDLTVIDDLLVEPGALESVVIEFGQPDVGILGNTTLFELLIADNDQQTIQFILDQQDVNEDSGLASFTVVSNRTANTDISIPVAVVLDSVEASDLSGLLPAEVILPAGQTETSFSIAITNDSQNEPTEYFTVFLGTPSGGGQLGEKDYQKVTVRNDDPFALISVVEDSFDETARTVDFNIRLTEPTNKDVVIEFDTFGNATLDQDYTVSPASSITIPAGQSEARIKATIRADATVEDDETVGVRIIGATNALVKSNIDRASIVLRNNDQAKVRFSTEGTNFDEGTTFQVKVRVSQTLTEDIVVPVKGISGSGKAKLGVDYRLQGLGQGGTVTIPAGQREATFNVSIVDDIDFEGSERIVLQLGQSNVSAVELDSSLLTFRVNASDKLLARKIYYNPGGFGLETYGPGQLAIDPAQLPKMGPNDTLVIETNQGSAIQLSQDDIAEFIAQGQLAVSTGGNGNNTDIASGSSSSLAIGAGVVAVDTSGSIEFDPIDPATVLLLKGSPGLANTGNGARIPGTINLAVTSEQGNLFGSTAFFDANRNGLIDFLDLNGDGIQQFAEPTEPSATTRLDGSFDLALPTTLDGNGDGLIDSRDGRFVLIGGIDTATELPMPLVLEAAVGHYNVSPLSTLAAKLVYDFGTVNTVAEQRALNAFGIEGARFSNAQSIAAAGVGDSGAARIAIANAQLQATTISIGSLFSPLPSSPQMSVLGQLIFQDMGDKIQSAGSRLDLSSEVQIDSIVAGIEFQLGLELPSDVRSAAIQAISEANDRLGKLDTNANSLLQDRAKHEVFFIGQLAPALSQLSAGSLTAADLISNYTGAAAESRVAAAAYGIINPPRVAISSVKTPETESAGLLRFEVNISGDVTRNVELSYETVLDDAVAGEVTPVSGTLNWQPGDNSTRIIEVPFQGDSSFEEDESVLLALTSVSNAVLANDIGVGYILNDDSLTFTAPAIGQSNDLELFVDGQQVQMFANQEYVFGGFHTGGAASTITGSAGVDDSLSIQLGEQNTFLTRGLHFEGNGDAGDVLSVDNSLAMNVVHRSIADGSGEFENDGRSITYANLANVSDELAPAILGLPSAIAETDEVSLSASIPEILESGTVSWLLSAGETQLVSYEGATFNYEFVDSGIYELQVTVETSNGRSAARVVSLQVQNLDPTAVDDAVNAAEDADDISIDVLANDSDPAAADAIEVVSIDTTGTIGSVAFTSTGVTYNPNGQFESLAKDETANDSFSYTIADGDGGTSTATVIVSVLGQNDSPVSLDVTDDANEDGGSINVAADFSDVDASDSHTFGLDTTGMLGSVANNADGTFTYDPNGAFETLADGETATDSFAYTVDDGKGGTSTASVIVTITGQNDTPVAVDVTDDANEDGGSISVAADFSDVDGSDSHTFGLDTTGMLGSVANNADGTFTYDPNAVFETLADGETATDSFAYTVDDGKGGTSTASVIVTITGQNDAPVAVDVTDDANEDGGSISVAADFSDVDETDSYTFGLNTTGTLGSVTNNADGTFTYDPNGAFEALADSETATDSFTYTVDDGKGGTSTASVIVTITGQNDDPVAVDVTDDANEDGGSINIAANFSDVDASDSHVFSVDTIGTLGSVTNNADGTFTYDPNGAFESLAVDETATDSFAYTVDDGKGGTSTASVVVTITGQNDAPVAVDVTDNANEDVGIISVAADFSDVDETDSHTFGLDTTGTLGSVTNNADGTFTYDSNGAFESLAVGETVTDSFAYTVDDGKGGTSTASVEVTVAGQNDAPVAVDVTDHANEDGGSINIAANFSDVDLSDSHTFGLDATGTLGSVTNNANGTFTYDPNGAFEALADGETATDSFAYTVDDGKGGRSTASVEVTITGQNDAPEAVDDVDTLINTDNSSVEVLLNDNDVDFNDTLSLVPGSAEVISSTVTLSTALVAQTVDTITFQPGSDFDALAAGETATVVIGYRVTDDSLNPLTSDATLTLTIQGTNVAPVLESLSSNRESLERLGGTSTRVVVEGAFSDLDLSDQHDIAVDWGDGNTEQVDSLDTIAKTFRSSHRYEAGGIYTVMTTVTDATGLQDTRQIEVAVTGVGIQERTLYIIGTSDRDRDVDVKTTSRGSLVNVNAELKQGDDQLRINQSFESELIDQIVVIVGKGNDNIHIHQDITMPTTILAGNGDDLAIGGSGPDAIFGGKGHDQIFGGRGDDLLVGGKGCDRIKAGRGDDLLIGGLVDVDLSSLSALDSIDSAMQAWEQQDLAATLLSLGGLTDDDEEDSLEGQQGTDEILGGLGDSIRQ